ncbi:MAG: winged helix-turn-helix transcriptional regulator [Fibrobacter sp.]|nr:winged helix-turn-helix transcriptional regulator [Fibrobacter sp.]
MKIIEMIKENPEITIPMMAETLRLTTRAVEKNVARLQVKGIVKRVGPDKGGHWEVRDEINARRVFLFLMEKCVFFISRFSE